MKSIICFFLLSYFSILAVGQDNKREVMQEIKIGTLSCEYTRSIEMATKDTFNYIFISFQNQDYSSITDIKSILLNANEGSQEVYEFIQDLKEVEKSLGTGTDFSWKTENYELRINSSSSKMLFVYSDTRSVQGYTTLIGKQVTKLKDWLELVWIQIVQL